MRCFLAIIAFALFVAPVVRAGDGLAPNAEIANNDRPRIDFNQKPGDKVPLDLMFIDDAGNEVTLRDCINNKPTIVIMAYYGCRLLCGEVFGGVLDGLKKMRTLTCGEDFNMVVVSFDPKEKPGLALAKKRAFVNEYGRKAGDWGCRFLTGKKENIDVLAKAVGFAYEWDPMLKEYNHPSGIMIVTPEGVISRYLAGIEYLDRNDFNGQYTADPSRTLRWSLMEAGNGEIGKTTDKAFLICFAYSPHTGKYSFNVMLLMRAAGVLTLLTIAAFYARRSWHLPGVRVMVVGIVLFIGVAIPFAMFTTISLDPEQKWQRWAVRGTLLAVGTGLVLIGRKIWKSARKSEPTAEPVVSV